VFEWHFIRISYVIHTYFIRVNTYETRMKHVQTTYENQIKQVVFTKKRGCPFKTASFYYYEFL